MVAITHITYPMRPTLPTWTLMLCAAGAGCMSMAVEISAGRLMTPHVGGTIYTWGALIGAFMAGMAIGYDLGGRMADRWPQARLLAVLFLGSAASIAIIPIYASALMPYLATHIQDLRYAALAGAVLLTGLPAALLAATGPYCLKLARDREERTGRIAGRLSAMGATGSIVGTLGSSFYLIPNLPLSWILLFLAAGCAALSVVVWIADQSGRANRCGDDQITDVAPGLGNG